MRSVILKSRSFGPCLALVLLQLAGSVTLAAGGSGIMLRPSGMYWSQQDNDGAAAETKTTQSEMGVVVALGFRMESGIFIGGSYTYFQQETKVETTVTVETKKTHTAYGPTIGYSGMGLYILGTYHLSPVYITGTDAAKNTYFGGTGYQVDLGYIFWFANNMAFGPQITYYRADFKKLKDTAGLETELTKSAGHTDIRPMVALAFMF